MCTANLEICKKVKELKELRLLMDELEAEISTLTDEIKVYMGNDESMIAGPFKVGFKTVSSNRLDTTSLRRELPDIAARYMKTTTTRRFTIN